MPAEDPVTPLRGTPAPARQSAHSQVVPVAREPAPRESAAPAARVHPVVQAIDHLGELAAVVIAGYLCAAGKATFAEFAAFSGIVLGVQNGIRQIGGRATNTNLSGAAGLVFVAMGAGYLRSRGMLQVAGALALAVASSTGLTACGGTAQALNPKPVWGMRSDPEFGRCAFAGTWVGTAPGARSLMTAHACLRIENGSSPAPDAGPAPNAGAPPMPPIANADRAPAP